MTTREMVPPGVVRCTICTLRVAISLANPPLGRESGSRSKHPGRKKRLGTSFSGSSVDSVLRTAEWTRTQMSPGEIGRARGAGGGSWKSEWKRAY